MKKVIVDLTDCKCVSELHRRFQIALDFPDYYGKNSDAFWDCISVDCDVDFVTIIGSKSISSELNPTIEQIVDLLEDNKREWADSDCPFDYEIVS